MAGPTNYRDWLGVLNQLAGTVGNGENACANAAWAAALVTTATQNLGLLAALNHKGEHTEPRPRCGLQYMIAGTTNNSPVSAPKPTGRKRRPMKGAVNP